jgi:hypothetical protein
MDLTYENITEFYDYTAENFNNLTLLHLDILYESLTFQTDYQM